MTKPRQAGSRYFSDLDDAQWGELKATAFRDEPDADSLRPLVNALVYRARARCRWDLLPRGFPPAEVLRSHLERWKADGRWEQIRKASELEFVDPPAWPVLYKMRKAGARALRRMPGGKVVLLPGRAVIRAGEYLLSRFTPGASLHGLARRAHALTRAKRHGESLEYYSRILDIAPGNVPTLLERATAYLELSRYDEAVADCVTALSSLDLEFDHLVWGHYLLSQVYSVAGEYERGIGHWFEARRFQLQGPAAPWDSGVQEYDPDTFEMLGDAYNTLAEYVINMKGDFVGAVRLYQKREELCDRYRAWLEEQPKKTLYLVDDWARQIGHIALLDLVVKANRMGWLPYERVAVLAPTAGTANVPFMNYFRPHMTVVGAPSPGGSLAHLAATLGRRVACAIDLPDGTGEYFCNVLGVIQEAWEKGGGQPLLTLSDDDRRFGEENLRALGVPAGAWFVCLHVRSSGFYKEQRNDHQSHRNADIGTYLPAVREITRRGGWVVRLGDPTMAPFPKTAGVVDYARSKLKSARMDVFLCGACRFYLGVASGLCQVPPTFGVPVVTTNWASNQPLATYYAPDLCLPKLLWSDREDRPLTFVERFTDPAIRYCHSNNVLRENGLRAIDNTPEEIRDVVLEMLDRLDGVGHESAADRELADRFAALFREVGVRGTARIGRDFLRTHARLLPELRRAAA